MSKQLFYVFDEHTDYVQACIKLCMKPIKYHHTFPEFVEEFNLDGVVYKTLGVHECYSGWCVTIMATPRMEYSQLITALVTTNIYDEFVGCLGILLKYHRDEFVVYLAESAKNDKRIKKIKKVILRDLAENCEIVRNMTQLLEVCKS